MGTLLDVDALDHALLRELATGERVPVVDLARRLGVARGTAQARLDRLVRSGVVRDWAPQLSATALGLPVTAFVTLEIRQGVGHGAVVEHLRAIPQVLEAHTTTGDGDLLVRVAARDNADLQAVLDRVVASPDVRRTSSVVALSTPIELDVGRLLAGQPE
ncbi:MAG: AsnC family transcriptional regulator [Frankiales bacterium]|nr:AsnC family transcriptional regulator [Frankiales bacterium]